MLSIAEIWQPPRPRSVLLPSKARRRARTHQMARLVAHAAEAVGVAAVEVVGVAGAEDAALVAHGHLHAAGDDDAAFLAVVRQRDAAGVGAGGVALLQDLQGAAGQRAAHLPV